MTLKKSTSIYTPVVIQYVPAVVLPGQDTSDYKNVRGCCNRIKINPPHSTGETVEQTLQAPVFVTIPSSGLVRLQLVPSDRYIPYGRYEVEYFVSGNSMAVRNEKWIVPCIIESHSVTVTSTADPLGDSFNIDDTGYTVWSIDSISRPGSYEFINQKIRWLSNPPALNETYNVFYKPALTLGHILENKHHKT